MCLVRWQVQPVCVCACACVHVHVCMCVCMHLRVPQRETSERTCCSRKHRVGQQPHLTPVLAASLTALGPDTCPLVSPRSSLLIRKMV